MKLTFFQVSKELVLSELIKDPAYGFYVWLAWIFGINQNVIQIHNEKNIKLFGKNLIDVTLKTV